MFLHTHTPFPQHCMTHMHTHMHAHTICSRGPCKDATYHMIYSSQSCSLPACVPVLSFSSCKQAVMSTTPGCMPYSCLPGNEMVFQHARSSTS